MEDALKQKGEDRTQQSLFLKGHNQTTAQCLFQLWIGSVSLQKSIWVIYFDSCFEAQMPGISHLQTWSSFFGITMPLEAVATILLTVSLRSGEPVSTSRVTAVDTSSTAKFYHLKHMFCSAATGWGVRGKGMEGFSISFQKCPLALHSSLLWQKCHGLISIRLWHYIKMGHTWSNSEKLRWTWVRGALGAGGGKRSRSVFLRDLNSFRLHLLSGCEWITSVTPLSPNFSEVIFSKQSFEQCVEPHHHRSCFIVMVVCVQRFPLPRCLRTRAVPWGGHPTDALWGVVCASNLGWFHLV